MSAASPLVSVVIPVHNGARHLRDAVTSIEGQAYAPIEIIVVDDGSTDDTPRVIDGLGRRVRAARQENAGPAAARNRGLALARGELLAFCDADDAWPAGKLALQVGRLVRDPALDVVLGRVQYLAEAGEEYPNVPFEDFHAKTIMHVHLGSGVFRRSAFERVGDFDESLRFSEDVDWFFRARELGVQIRILRDVTLHYRIHGENMTRGLKFREFQFMTVLKKSLERRRAAGLEGTSLRLWRDLDDESYEDPAPGRPTVTVIIPVFEDTRYLDEAIESALAQTHRPLEIFVIDDGSSEPVVLSPRYPRNVVLKRSRHRGQGGARNVAAARAHGEVLAFLDADDVWLPEKLELQLAALADGSLDMVFATFEEFVSPELSTDAGEQTVTRRRGPLPSAFIVRTKAFRRVGEFREDIMIGDFIDWHSRAVDAGLREAGIDAVVARRRIHDRNAGIVLRDLRGQYAHVLKERLDRRRAQP